MHLSVPRLSVLRSPLGSLDKECPAFLSAFYLL
eukprot:COSAG02_NODE_63285_length_263_cov_1.140244_1_plen_32_part_10